MSVKLYYMHLSTLTSSIAMIGKRTLPLLPMVTEGWDSLECNVAWTVIQAPSRNWLPDMRLKAGLVRPLIA